MNNPASDFYIGKQHVGNSSPTFFIADIGANHDGDLSRAKDLIRLAKKPVPMLLNFNISKIIQLLVTMVFEHLVTFSRTKLNGINL